jgi:hypothetical protein
MRTVKYNWDPEIYLIHVDVVNSGEEDSSVRYSRTVEASGSKDEEYQRIKAGERSRFMISKKGIKEISVLFTHDNSVELRVFKLLDRAYLPTDSDICELETL